MIDVYWTLMKTSKCYAAMLVYAFAAALYTSRCLLRGSRAPCIVEWFKTVHCE